MYYVNFDPSTNVILGVSPQKQDAVSIEIADDLGRLFEDGVENFMNWHVQLDDGEYIFKKNTLETTSNKNIYAVPKDSKVQNYVEFVQKANKISLHVQGDEEYKDYIAKNDTLVNIFVTAKNNPYALLNTMHFMLKEATQNLEYEFDTEDISLYMHNPAYTFKHTIQ